MSVSEIQTKISYLARRIALSRRRMTKKQKEIGYFATMEKIKRRDDAEELAMFTMHVDDVAEQSLRFNNNSNNMIDDDPILHLYHKFDRSVEHSMIQEILDQEMGDIVATENILKSATAAADNLKEEESS